MSTIAMVIILTVGIVEIFGFTAAIYVMNRKLEELRMEREKYNTGIFRTLSTFLDGLKKRNDKQNQLIHDIKEQSKILKEQYEALDEAYDYMNERYREICEHYSNLLKCWNGVEERYSDCYEQLKYQNERFDKIEKYFEEQRQFIWHPEEDIDVDAPSLVTRKMCEYNYFPKDCWDKNCEHFHTTDMSVGDLLCACDVRGYECDACDEGFCYLRCPLEEKEEEGK